MSKEILDYQKLCSNYYSSWEEGCCMESCEFYNHNECPVVYVNGLLEERDKTIADLEAKLAERKEFCISQTQSLLDINNALIEEHNKLKQQLVEKEDKIETLKQRIDSIVKIYSDDFVSKDTELKELRHKVKQHDQDKISFAVEQLTQAKEYIKNSLENMWNGNGEMTCRDRSIIDGVYTKLDEQIEELTHQHEDKGE